MVELRVYFPSSDSWATCAVRDLWVDFDGPLESIAIKPFETSAQALQREFPDCEIFVVGDNGRSLKVNPPGMREWIA